MKKKTTLHEETVSLKIGGRVEIAYEIYQPGTVAKQVSESQTTAADVLDGYENSFQ